MIDAERYLSHHNRSVWHPQEHVLLLRALIQAVPGSFKQLQGLTDPDPEADFFHNVAHLQLHRRSRALARLSRVSCAAGSARPLVGQL